MKRLTGKRWMALLIVIACFALVCLLQPSLIETMALFGLILACVYIVFQSITDMVDRVYDFKEKELSRKAGP